MDVTEQTFEIDVLELSRELPVVVDFWAAWCGPCQRLGPILEQAVAEREGAVALVKVDIDEQPALAQRYEIRSIPAVKAFRNGRVQSEFAGLQSPQSIAAFLDALNDPSELERVLEELQEASELEEVREALEAGDFGCALELLLAGVLATDHAQERDRLRRLMVAIFTELGPEHSLSTSYRRRLATALY